MAAFDIDFDLAADGSLLTAFSEDGVGFTGISGGSGFKFHGGRMYGDPTGTELVEFAALTTASTFSTDLFIHRVTNAGEIALCFCADANMQNGYMCRISSSQIQCWKATSGGFAILGSSYSITASNNTDLQRIRIIVSATQIQVVYGLSTVITISDSTHPREGKLFFRNNITGASPTAGYHLDKWALSNGNLTDTTAPVITLVGDATYYHEVNTAYTDPGFTATDDTDGDITGSVVVGGATVDANTVGSYVVTYDVADAAGNNATQVTRTVVVYARPVITLNGAATIELPQGDAWVDPGATATDTEDGDISGSIVVGGDTVDSNTLGTYTISYDVVDSDANAAVTVYRTVNVNPVVTLSAKVAVLDGSKAQHPQLTGIHYAIYDQTDPALFEAPTKKGFDGAIDASGNFITTVPATALNAADECFVIMWDSTGDLIGANRGVMQ